jgi:hypothetical protein
MTLIKRPDDSVHWQIVFGYEHRRAPEAVQHGVAADDPPCLASRGLLLAAERQVSQATTDRCQP